VFDADEVDGLLRRSRAGRDSAQELTIATAVSSIADGELRYRGRLVPELAATEPFESVASLLWTGALAWRPCAAAPGALDAVEAVGHAVPAGARLIDRIRIATDVAAVADPLRFELAAASVTACGRALVGVLVDALRPRGRRRRAVPLVLPGADPHPDAVASRLWPRLSPLPPTEGAVRALNGTLVLCADHELATSTFAVRVAASTRANPYAAVAAGLGALDGPLHGTVSELVHQLLADAERDGVDAAVARRLRHGDRLPGFGHPLYPGGDPRAPALLGLLEVDGFDPARRTVAAAVLDAVVGRTGAAPNSDFGLGALAFAGGMSPDAGEAVFAIGRCAGWLAHALEEYAEAPLRFRLRARTLT
jgi:citrate synthase